MFKKKKKKKDEKCIVKFSRLIVFAQCTKQTILEIINFAKNIFD